MSDLHDTSFKEVYKTYNRARNRFIFHMSQLEEPINITLFNYISNSIIYTDGCMFSLIDYIKCYQHLVDTETIRREESANKINNISSFLRQVNELKYSYNAPDNNLEKASKELAINENYADTVPLNLLRSIEENAKNAIQLIDDFPVVTVQIELWHDCLEINTRMAKFLFNGSRDDASWEDKLAELAKELLGKLPGVRVVKFSEKIIDILTKTVTNIKSANDTLNYFENYQLIAFCVGVLIEIQVSHFERIIRGTFNNSVDPGERFADRLKNIALEYLAKYQENR